MRGLRLTMWVIAMGCAGDKGDTLGPADSVPGETGIVELVPFCADASWGSISDPTAAVFVTADGTDDGDGTLALPYLTIGAALERTREEDAPKRIAIGPGAFDAEIALSHDLGDGVTDDALAIEGCGTDETTLTATSDDTYILKASSVQGWSASGFTLSGGRRTVWIWQEGTAVLTQLSIIDANRSAIVMDGSYGLLDVVLDEVAVSNVTSDLTTGGYGYGIAVQGSSSAHTVTLHMSGGSVTAATQAGLFVTGTQASAILESVEISETVPDTHGYFGRGVQVQGGAAIELRDMTLSGNADAGIYAYESTGVILTDVSVSDVVLGVDADGVVTGDGVVITQDPDHHYAPESFPFALERVSVTNSPRAGVLLSGVAGTTVDTTGSGLWTGDSETGTPFSVDYNGEIVTQNGASIVDTSGLNVQDLAETITLSVNLVGLDSDDFTE